MVISVSQNNQNVPLERSGHQTQTVDLSREEGVEDEDYRLRTRVEVQLLEEEGKKKKKSLKSRLYSELTTQATVPLKASIIQTELELSTAHTQTSHHCEQSSAQSLN